MIKGIGTDIVELKRISQALERRGEAFARRILTPAELLSFQRHAQPAAYLAKRFAAKEALAKALGTGIAKGIGFQQIETQRQPSGAPTIHLTGVAAEYQQRLGVSVIHLSLSDERDFALAFVVLEG